MSETVISIDNISKIYRLGSIGSSTIREDFERFWCRISGKSDPLAGPNLEREACIRAPAGLSTGPKRQSVRIQVRGRYRIARFHCHPGQKERTLRWQFLSFSETETVM